MNRRTRAFLFGAVVTAGWLAAPALAEEAGDLVAKGRAQIAKGDWTGAAATFEAAAKKDPASLEARRGAAESLLGLGRADEAIEHADVGLEIAKNQDGGLWLLLARAYLRKGDVAPAGQEEEMRTAYADAKAKAAMALKQDPSLQLARAVLARACRLTDDLERADQVLREGLTKAPKDFDLLLERGALDLKRKEFDAALRAFSGAAEADPTSAEAEFQKAVALAWLKRWDEAKAAYARSAVLDPAEPSRRALKGLVKTAGDKCIPSLREVLKAKPDHAWAHAYLAYYLAVAKDESHALEEAKKAMALQPEDLDLVVWHATVLEALGRPEDARAVCRKVLEKNPRAKAAFDRLSDFALNPRSTAKPSEKREVIEYLVRLGTGDGDFWNNVGLYYRDIGKDARKSLEAYLRAAALSPDDQGVQNDTGLIYLYFGKQIGEDPRKALPFFERTLALVEQEDQKPEMGYRDTLQNLAQFYKDADPNPERALFYAEKRNDPEFLGTLSRDLAAPSREAAAVKEWAERELKK